MASKATRQPAPVPSTWSLTRSLAAFAAALLVFLAVAGGLFFYATALQVALVCGAIAGIIGCRTSDSAAAAGVAVLLGWAIYPPFASGVASSRGLEMLASAAGAALAAAGANWLANRFGRRVVKLAVPVLVGVLVANLWASSYGMQAKLGQLSVTTWLRQTTTVSAGSDADAYLLMVRRLSEGSGYYAAVRAVDPLWNRVPHHVYEVRPPALYETLGLLGRSPSAILVAFLIVASGAVVGAALLTGAFAKPQFGVVGAAVVAMVYYFLGLFSEGVIFTESWASALAILALGLLAQSAVRSKWRALFFAGLAVAVLAAATREFFLVLPLAGLVSTWRSPKERRLVQRLAWGASLAALALYYGAHWQFAKTLTVTRGASPTYWRPGIENLVLGVKYFAASGGFVQWTAALFFILGLSALAMLTKGEAGLLVGAVVAVFLVFFAANSNLSVEQGQYYNYWGIAFFPVLCACAPLCFALVPGLARRRSAG